MSRQQCSAVRKHVNGCISRCYKAEFPLACLAELMDELRSDGCTDAQIHQIEQAVFKLLAGIVRPVWQSTDQALRPAPPVSAATMRQAVG